ncbi:MAG: phenylalanine--tRNA ligase subunit beta [Endomicrobia bacterium]|nr:phenylalanine--tRNA ligase subunit beta [Endomicrobiia bacterium]
MKLSLLWLKEILNVNNFPDDKIIDIIEQLGYEIESVERKDSDVLSKVKVVKVVSVEKHPNADKLVLCKLTDGKTENVVVCGAPNVYQGMLSAYVSAGDKLADGRIVEPKKIRGIISNGMLCSAKELGLYDDHSGILDLDTSFVLGSTLDRYFNDVIIDIATPANRYNCLGHLGIAKEVAIKINHEIKTEPQTILSFENKKLPFFDVKIVSTELCKRYIAIQVNNVNNKTRLPFFITYRINVLGIRSISPLVDISNYVMLEVGHSVHIFDYDKLKNGKIIVRNANKGETIVALDGKEYILAEDMIVIADDAAPVAIAGIIGGKNSCVDDNTQNIVIESALFNRSKIRITKKQLGINTEASYRFERGSGWNLCELAAIKTYNMITKYCGGEMCRFSDEKDLNYYTTLTSFQQNGIRVNLDFLSSFLGFNVDTKSFIDLFRALGSEVKLSSENMDMNRVILLLPPLDRQDIKFQADVAEEIARFTGYDCIAETLPPNVLKYIRKNDVEKFYNQILNYLTAMGFNQVINYTLCSTKENEVIINNEEKKINILNPVSNEYSELRLSLFSSLLKNLVLNYNNQTEPIALTELGKVFYKQNAKLVEEYQIGLIIYGELSWLGWKHKVIEYDFYYLCGVVEKLLKTLGLEYVKSVENVSTQEIVKPKLHPEFVNSLVYYFDVSCSKILAQIFEIKKEKLKLKLPKPVFYGEVYIEDIKALVNKEKAFTMLPKYPYILRDLCFIVPENITYQKIDNIISSYFKNKNLDNQIVLSDYHKKENFTTITITLKIRDRNKTLTDEETNCIIAQLIDELKHYRIQLREK